MSPVSWGPWSVWVDGKLQQVNLEDWRMQWNVPLFVKLPPDSLVPGRPVDIAVAFPFRVSQGYAMGSMYIGPANAVQRMHFTRMFWQNTLPQAAILITLLLGLLAFHYWLGDRGDRAYAMLAFVAIIWFLANTQYFGDFADDNEAVEKVISFPHFAVNQMAWQGSNSKFWRSPAWRATK